MIRSMMLALVVAGAVGCMDSPAEDSTAAVEQGVGGHFGCSNGINVVTCNETALLIPVNINIKDNNVLTNNDITVLKDNLNDLTITLKDVVDVTKILNDNEVKVFDVLNGLGIANITKNDIDVCALVGVLQLCK